MGNDSNTQRDEHIRQRSCEKKEFLHAGVTPDQMKLIVALGKTSKGQERKPPAQKAHEKWYNIYRIIFCQDAPLPASPYLSELDRHNATELGNVIEGYKAQGHPEHP